MYVNMHGTDTDTPGLMHCLGVKTHEYSPLSLKLWGESGVIFATTFNAYNP